MSWRKSEVFVKERRNQRSLWWMLAGSILMMVGPMVIARLRSSD